MHGNMLLSVSPASAAINLDPAYCFPPELGRGGMQVATTSRGDLHRWLMQKAPAPVVLQFEPEPGSESLCG